MDSIATLIDQAYQRIEKHIVKTPLEFSPALSALSGAEVYLKLESLQTTGSFKLRGALNKIISLNKSDLEKGVVTASTGNHAAAVAHALQTVGAKGTIYMPQNVSEAKQGSLSFYEGIEVELFGNDSVEAELKALNEAQKAQRVYISPYNDIDIVAGQGTIGVELLEQLPNLDAVFVPIGGGGLISGIAGYLKEKTESIRIIGCQPENSAVMYHSINAGKVIQKESLPTLSDGTAGGVEEDTITFGFCQRWVDEYSLITEKEITEGLKLLLKEHYLLVEGAAALSVASLLKNKEKWAGKKVVLILCGRKLPFNVLKEIICD